MANRKYKSIFCVNLIIIVLLLTACSGNDADTFSIIEEMETSGTEVRETLSAEDKIAQVVSVPEPEMSETELRDMEAEQNRQSELSVPTDVRKIDGIYFIVDCYNNQVIYSEDIEKPLTEWNIMSNKISKGHTIASDGRIYLLDDTENNRILVYHKEYDKFIHLQTLENVGERPHYILYDERSEAFYVLSSMSGEIYILKTDDDREVYVSDIKTIDSITSSYCRSFTIAGDTAYFPGTNHSIVKTTFPEFMILEEYEVPDEITGLVQISLIHNNYYLTVSTDSEGNQDFATIIRTDDLDKLKNGEYEDIYTMLEPDKRIAGTPYCISEFDGHYYMVEHRHVHGLFQFDVEEGEIKNVEILH